MANQCEVARRDGGVVFVARGNMNLTRADALNLAANLVERCEFTDDELGAERVNVLVDLEGEGNISPAAATRLADTRTSAPATPTTPAQPGAPNTPENHNRSLPG